MVIRTETPRVQQAVRARNGVSSSAPSDRLPVCDQSGECWLQDYYMAHAGHESRYPGTRKPARVKAYRLGRSSIWTGNAASCARVASDLPETSPRRTRLSFSIERTLLKLRFTVKNRSKIRTPATSSIFVGRRAHEHGLSGSKSAHGSFRARRLFAADAVRAAILRIDHSARATGGGILVYTASEGKIYRTVVDAMWDVNKSWLCDEGRLSFHSMEKWPRLRELAEDRTVGDCCRSPMKIYGNRSEHEQRRGCCTRFCHEYE
jgi:hypothetical protein